MKKPAVFLIIVLLMSSIVFAHGNDIFDEARELVESGISCDELTDDQLEIIGDYVMEQMHPGAIHSIMDERMGGEGSAQLRQAHINMAQRFYCEADMEHGMMFSLENMRHDAILDVVITLVAIAIVLALVFVFVARSAVPKRKRK